MKNENETLVIYETDNIEQAKLAASRNKNISVVYHNSSAKTSPILTFKTNGRCLTKWNPEYVEYLKKKHPGISEKEIALCIKMAVAKMENIQSDSLKSTNYIQVKVQKRTRTRKR